MERLQGLSVRIVAGAIFGAAGAAASLFFWHFLAFESTSPKFFQSAAISAAICGFLLGPNLFLCFPCRGALIGIIVTYFASLITPAVLATVNHATNFALPSLSPNDVFRLAGLPFLAVFGAVPAAPFGIVGGVLFANIARRILGSESESNAVDSGLKRDTG